MENEKIIKAITAEVSDDVRRGVKFIYQTETDFKELKNIEEIIQKILQNDRNLIIDCSQARPPPVN